jgi:hypothetical protein
MKKLYLPFWFLLAIHSAFGSGDPYPAGARAWGLGNAAATLADSWSLFNNPAGISGVSQVHLLAAYDNRYGLPGMQSMATGVVYPSDFGNVGLSIHRFGDELYSEHLVGVAYSHKVSRVMLGAKLNYVQVHVDNLGSKGTIALEFGGIAEITPQLFFGAHVYNFNQAKLADYQDERIPTVMKAGISYKAFNKLLLSVETEKDVDFPATVKAGIEYQIVKNLYLRTGMSSKPFVNYFGIGFSPKRLQFDYSVRSHPVLGMSHHLSIGFRLEKKRA